MRNSRINRRKGRLLIVFAVMILTGALITGVLLVVMADIRRGERSNKAAELWQGDGATKYAQIALYLADEARYDSAAIQAMRSQIEAKLTTNIAHEGGGRMWYDCYSTEGRLSFTGNDGSAECAVTAVGGDFFLMHEQLEGMSFISGSAFCENDIMEDRVVLDRNAAWKLFGAYDIAGQYIYCGSASFVVAGVVEGADEEPYLSVYGERPRIYMPYSAFTAAAGDIPVSCYEAVMPDPISDFAADTVNEACSAAEGDYELKEVSSRYSLVGLYSTLGGLSHRSMKTTRVIYPYWENAAGVIEDRLAVIQLFATVTFAVTALALFVLIIIGYNIISKKITEMRKRK